MVSERYTMAGAGCAQVFCFSVGIKSTCAIVLFFLLLSDCSGCCGRLGVVVLDDYPELCGLIFQSYLRFAELGNCTDWRHDSHPPYTANEARSVSGVSMF